jgi:methylenetetrahydrofolate dehydrogenase (NADP+)/methenyltetrahydrofolate cyclohydrolase
MQIIDGKAIAQRVQDEVKAAVAELEGGARPTIALVQVGDDPASSVYVRTKHRMSEYCGIESEYMHLPANVSEEKLLQTLHALSEDGGVNGILLQLPLPKHIDPDKGISAIAPIKDVDGFHPENLGRLASGKPRYVPCTPAGIRELLRRYDIDTAGKNAVVIGRSIIVGKPMALLLAMKGHDADATVTICHSRTRNIGDITSRADIIVAAIGRAEFLKGDMVKDGAVVIDVGMNRVDDASTKKGYRLVGDVDFAAVSKKASHITPVPGGVGPMTVAMLMANTLRAYQLQVNASNVV